MFASDTGRDHHTCRGVWYEGEAVRVFSRWANKWVDGIIASAEGEFAYVEYMVGEYRCRKVLRMREVEQLHVKCGYRDLCVNIGYRSRVLTIDFPSTNENRVVVKQFFQWVLDTHSPHWADCFEIREFDILHDAAHTTNIHRDYDHIHIGMKGDCPNYEMIDEILKDITLPWQDREDFIAKVRICNNKCPCFGHVMPAPLHF